MSDSPPGTPPRTITNSLLAALATRDLRRIEAMLSPDCSWQNVPHPPAEGRDAVMALLAPIVTWSDRVQWDVQSAAYDDTTAWLERADRFWIDGTGHIVLCNGVFDVDVEAGVVRSVRDYVDLGEWRARVGPALEAMARRSIDQVLDRHLSAVIERDPVAMAADYAFDALLRRGDDEHRGWRAIADYFGTVPARLDGLRFSHRRSTTEPTAVRWELSDATDAVVARGTDWYVIADGRITEQTVELDTPDF